MQIYRIKFIVYANLLYKYSAGALNRLSGSERSEHCPLASYQRSSLPLNNSTKGLNVV